MTDSFHSAEKFFKQDPNLHTASLDVDSSFSSIPVDKIIDTYIDNFYKDNESPLKIPKGLFHNLLNEASKN